MLYGRRAVSAAVASVFVCVVQNRRRNRYRVGKCIDNGPMEGFWGILKRKRYYGKRFTDRASLVSMIEEYIEYYNYKRLQRNLGVMTPMQKHELYKAA